jgi:UDP-N-acetylmuramoyl-tripeptide--D-alanyl-D-alanine ligase
MSNWICTVQELAQAVGGQILSQNSAPFVRVATDTRADLNGKLFIPLKGEKFDGHDYVAQAVEKGATAVLVGQWRPEWQALLNKASFVQVPDTLQGLQSFGRFWRRKQKFKVLAITGSNGKTSTKEFLYAILKQKYKTHASKGSYNNHWGVPLSILEAGSDITHLILEMGMNHSGELFRLCMVGEPDIVVVTTVGRAHIGELGSQENVAKAKEEIYVACSNAVQIFNVDNEWTMRMHARSHGKKMTFSSFKSAVDVNFRAQRLSWEGLDIVGHIRQVTGQSWVHVMGRQNVVNLMAASSLALAAGMTPEEIWDALPKISDTAWGRNQVLMLNNGTRVFFDAYNANPDSMQALLKNLYEMDVPGRKFLVVGDMRELGTFTAAAHEECGERAAACGFEAIWYIGANGHSFAKGLEKVAKPKKFHISADVDQKIAEEFLKMFNDGDLVAVKASRGMALERVLAFWPLKTPLGVKP